jgi:hypothetical protein
MLLVEKEMLNMNKDRWFPVVIAVSIMLSGVAGSCATMLWVKANEPPVADPETTYVQVEDKVEARQMLSPVTVDSMVINGHECIVATTWSGNSSGSGMWRTSFSNAPAITCDFDHPAVAIK